PRHPHHPSGSGCVHHVNDHSQCARSRGGSRGSHGVAMGGSRAAVRQRTQMRTLLVLTCLVAAAPAVADDGVSSDPASDHAAAGRDPDASLATIFHGPFQSSRLFAMPTADVVGAYMMSVSYDGSLLEHPGVLTSAGVLAIGFGDIAQLEYRHTSV